MENKYDEQLKQKVSAMDIFDKLRLYMEHFTTYSCLKNNFAVVDRDRFLFSGNKDLENLDDYHGWGKPDKEIHRVGIFHTSKDLGYMSFDHFLSGSITYKDIGEDWEKNKYATRYFPVYTGIYEYLNRNRGK